MVRDDRILMVKHHQNGEEWWCLPGGGIESGEKPDAAALRELKEECLVDGHLLRLTSTVAYSADDYHYTYLVEIGDQAPRLGDDPDKKEGGRILVDFGWRSLGDLSEADRCYLWTAGLLTIDSFAAEMLSWDRSPALPKKREPKNS